mgnify:CR=1 FL=1
MKNRFWTIFFVLIVPYTAIIGAFPFYNRVEPFVLGFPFFYFWLFSWFILTSISMYIGWRLDPLSDANRAKAGQQSGIAQAPTKGGM